MKRLKLEACLPAEKDVVADLQIYFANEPRVAAVTRVNSGGGVVKGRFIQFSRCYSRYWKNKADGTLDAPVTLDFVGFLVGGKYFEIEAKKPGKTPTQEQMKKIDLVKRHGGISGYVESWEAARDLIHA